MIRNWLWHDQFHLRAGIIINNAISLSVVSVIVRTLKQPVITSEITYCFFFSVSLSAPSVLYRLVIIIIDA